MIKIKTYFAIVTFLFLTVQKAFSQTSILENWRVEQVENTTIYTPPDLKKDEVFTITVFEPTFLKDESHEDWFKEFLYNDRLIKDKTASNPKITRSKNNTLMAGEINRDLSGTYYFSDVLQNNAVTVRKVYYSTLTLFARNQYPIIKVREEVNKRAAALTNKKPEKLAGGLKISDLHGMVYFYGNKRYDTFSNRWVFSSAATWLLLKNGWAYKNPKSPPSQINFENSKTEEPRKWRKWKGDKKFTNVAIYKPSKEGARYDITVKLPKVSGGPMNATSTKEFKLKKDGKFETDEFILAGKSITKTTKTSGMYHINGHTIELNFDDGRVERHIFATDGSKNIILGTSLYFQP